MIEWVDRVPGMKCIRRLCRCGTCIVHLHEYRNEVWPVSVEDELHERHCKDRCEVCRSRSMAEILDGPSLYEIDAAASALRDRWRNQRNGGL